MATSFETGDQTGNNGGDPADNGDNANRGGDNTSSFEYDGRTMTHEAAITKFRNADEHIKNLEEEGRVNRERVEALIAKLEEKDENEKRMNEIMERLGSGKQPDAGDDKDRKTVDEDKLAERAAEAAFNRMTQEQQREKMQQNVRDVSAKLKERFGDKTDETVFGITRELGYSDEEALAEAGRRPKAFLRLIGLEDKPDNSSPSNTQSSRRAPNKQDEGTEQSRKMVGVASTKNRIGAYESRVQEKLKQLGVTD